MLAAARAIDTSPVKARLDDFERAQHAYAEAHRSIRAAEAQVRAAQMRLAGADALQDKAITALGRTLIAGGQPLDHPFAAFGAPPVKALTRLPSAEKAVAVHQLVAALQRDDHLKDPARKAAQAADRAARGVEQALVPVEQVWQGLLDARRQRDVKAQAWDKAIDTLKSDARTVAKAGAAALYTALFPGRPSTKSRKAAANSPPATETPAAPTPPVTEPSKAA